MKRFVLAAVGIAGIAWAVPALTQPNVSNPAKAQAMTRADVAQKVQRHFSRLDSDGDGFVTRAEAEAVAAHRSHMSQMRPGKRRDPAAMFARIDGNKDGQITRAEADAARAALAERIQRKATGGLFDRADSNRDGIVTRGEFEAARALGRHRMMAGGPMRMHAMAGHMFEMADADKDGRVSLQEATAMSLRHFDSADSNRDGLVTREERRQLHRQMRQARQAG